MSKDRKIDRDISVDEANLIMADIILNQNTHVLFENKSLKIKSDDELLMEFVSLRDDPELVVRENKSFTTVSEWYIYYDNKTYRVNINKPFELSLEGLGINDLE